MKFFCAPRFASLRVFCLAGLLTAPSAGKLRARETPAAPPEAVPEAAATVPSFADMIERVSGAIATVINLRSLNEQESGIWRESSEDSRQEMIRDGGVFMDNGAPFTVTGHGSGAVVDAGGHVITNFHVVQKCWDSLAGKWTGGERFKVFLGEVGEPLGAELVGSDPATDVAVLRLSKPPETWLRAADGGTVRRGDWALAAGTPRGLEHRLTVTLGIVSAVGRRGQGSLLYEDFIQTDAAISPGNSGGPLLNAAGEIIGINQSILLGRVTAGGGQTAFSPEGAPMMTDSSTGIGYAVSANLAMKVKDELVAHGAVRRGYFGARLENPPASGETALNGLLASGAKIREVLKESPAAAAGFRQGDLIVKYAGKPVADAGSLRMMVAMTVPGEKAAVIRIRNGKPEEAAFTAGSLSDTRFRQIGYEPEVQRMEGLPGVELAEGEIVVPGPNGRPEPRRVVGVTDVSADSAAHRCGLRAQTLILEAAGVPVRSVREFAVVSGGAAGGPLLLKTLSRDKGLMEIVITPAAAAEVGRPASGK